MQHQSPKCTQWVCVCGAVNRALAQRNSLHSSFGGVAPSLDDRVTVPTTTRGFRLPGVIIALHGLKEQATVRLDLGGAAVYYFHELQKEVA